MDGDLEVDHDMFEERMWEILASRVSVFEKIKVSVLKNQLISSLLIKYGTTTTNIKLWLRATCTSP